MAIADNSQIQACTSPDTSGFASKNGWGSSLSFPVGVTGTQLWFISQLCRSRPLVSRARPSHPYLSESLIQIQPSILQLKGTIVATYTTVSLVSPIYGFAPRRLVLRPSSPAALNMRAQVCGRD